MADNDSNHVDNHSKKWGNSLKRMLDGAKKLVKKEENENEEPSFSDKSRVGKNQEPESSKAQKTESSEIKETEKQAQTKKAKSKEQKLPKKYRKGW
jgi:hypothetical protein